MSQTGTAPAPWTPPTTDQEWEVTDIASAPDWVDKSWASFDKGPAIAVPMGNLDGSGPHHSAFAHKGDTVKFSVKTNTFVIIPAEPPEEGAEPPKRAAQVSNASLEDQLKGGAIAASDLDDDAKAQVAARSPALKRMVEEE